MAQYKPTAVRKGKFLGLCPEEQDKFVSDLLKKINDGYYLSEKITEDVVDEIAPAIKECFESESVW